ncbi:hypothetical protein R5R35_004127 [Gryllus longicercus]|uniref:Uncharacterized protein n=1 Tax=Gryllus longicercus TaxID=2509291 RepID=A0AAN9VHC8_9ORTH
MRALCLLLLLLLMMMMQVRGRLMVVEKCCGAFKMLSSDGQSCVDAPWPRNPSIQERAKSGFFKLNSSDAPWVRCWLPPGVPIHRVSAVGFTFLKRGVSRSVVRAVATSAEWDERQVEAEGASYWRHRGVVFDRFRSVLRPDSFNIYFGFHQHENGCVDAAQPPLAPFALLMEPNCDLDECITKCCNPRKVMEANGHGWTCQNDVRGLWSPANSSFANLLPQDLKLDFLRFFYRKQQLLSVLRPTALKPVQIL